MLLTLNQVLLIILTLAAVVAATVLVMFLLQLRRTAREAEMALAKAQELMEGMKEIEAKLNANLDSVGEVLAGSKKALGGLSQLAFLSPRNMFKSSSKLAKYWPLIIPLVRFGWQLMRKRKEKRDG